MNPNQPAQVPMMNPQFKQIGESFVGHFYNLIDTNSDLSKGQVAQLYHENSLLTFEGDQRSGREGIMTKLMSMPQTKRTITRCDCQPTMGDNGVLVVVLGQVITPGEDKSLGFSNTFHLKPEGAGFYIFNEIFQLNLHNQ